MENNAFEYTYSAQRQQEIEKIRQAYLPKEEDKLDQLRKLHAIPTRKAQAVSVSAGILGALILGAGMSFIMTDLGIILGEYQDYSMMIGIVLGLAGMVPMALAYPIYNRILKKERKKIAPEILRLTDELIR